MNWRTFYFYFLILIPLAMSAIIGCQKHAAKTSENQNINGEQIAPQDTDSDLFPSGLEGTLALFPVKEGAASGSLSGIPQGKSGYVQFKNASIDFNPTSLELKLQVTVVTGHESQLIKLIGYMNETGRVDLEEAEKRSDGLDLRAIGQCLDPPKCPSGYVFVDVRYRENGVDREQQFVSVRAADEVSEKKSSESAPCDEFTGCAGKFVGHRVDKDYYKPLKNWTSPIVSPTPLPRSGTKDMEGEQHQTKSHLRLDAAIPSAPGIIVPSPGVRTPEEPRREIIPAQELSTSTDQTRGHNISRETKKNGETTAPASRADSSYPESPMPTDGTENRGGDNGDNKDTLNDLGQNPDEDSGVAPVSTSESIPSWVARDAERRQESPLLEESDLKLGAQSVGLPYSICLTKCGNKKNSGICQESKCGTNSSHQLNGSLQEDNDGPNLLRPEDGRGSYHVMTPERKQYYASGLMIRLISQVSQHFQELHRAKSPVLIVNALSRRGGGPLGSHSSHQNGLDADIVYLGEDKWQSVIVKGRVKDDFDYALNYDFFKILTETGFVNRIFVDSRIKRGMCQWVRDQGLMETEEAKEVLTKLRSWSGHDDHFHLRLVCSPFYPRCRDQTLPQGLGCPK